jgi:hypothetical protein
MADNTVQSGTDTIATDDVTTLNGNASSGIKVQRTKVTYGDDGTARDVSATFPLPVWDPDASASGTISATDAVVGVHAGAGVLLSGTPTANSYVALPLAGGDSGFVVQLTGTFGGGTVWFECSANSTTGIDGSWTTLSTRTIGTTGTTLSDSTTIAGLFRGDAAGMNYLRVRVTGATSPSISAVLRASSGVGPLALNAPLPAGPNTIGNIGIVASTSFVMTTGTLSTATVPGNPNTTSTTSAVVANVASAGNVTVYLYGGTYSVLALAFEVSPDGTNWFGINASRTDGTGTDVAPSFTTATIRAWEIVMPGVTYFRVRATAITQTVAPTVVIAPGGMVYDPSPVVTGTVSVAPLARTTGTASGNVFRTRVNPSAITASTALVAAPGTGLSIHLTDLSVSNAGATINTVSLLDGATNVMDMVAAPSGGGGSMNFQTPIKCTAATALNYTTSAASLTYITVTGYIA